MSGIARAASDQVAAEVRPSFRHRVEYLAYRVTRTVLGALPEGIAVRLAGGLGWIAGVVLRIRRQDVDAHLAIAFPDRDSAWRRSIARRSYAHLGREAALLFRMRRWSADKIASRVELKDFEAILEAAEADRGVVLLTAHLGNWEIAGASIAASGFPIDVVGKGMANRRFETDLFATRERLGMRVIDMGDAPKGVLRSLRKGRLAALLGDQNARHNGVFIPFFGRDAATPRGPAVFALRCDAPVFVGFAIRQPGWCQHYRVEVHRLDFERTGDLEADTKTMLTSYHTILEEAIVTAPDQYFWQHKRWKTRPARESGA